ncbi:MerR family transcriptional regulator [Zhouia sp. PK063]|uniref:MerR family transcriptional regulator n=1 Tax=Zhouia sp. PK063 TaxID=3373602 RepID=UPI0037A31433
MQNIKENFSIKDLENLSGIKAHTIRIWEKRYGLLEPQRTDTNIRYYDIENLQKLLNITLLYNNGFKISKIAKFQEKEIPLLVKEIISENSIKNRSINAFKLAMLNFDQTLFINAYNSLILDKSFREIFHDVFVPLLNEIGLLWQTNTIKPSHEHFITNLIKQKILINTEKLQLTEPNNKEKTFVLFLPENEIHEIGLLYLNYEITLRGYQSIYLGQAIPTESLSDLHNYYSNINFLSYFTIQPAYDRVDSYLKEFQNEVLKPNNSKLWILGKQTSNIDTATFSGVEIFNSIQSLVKQL